MSKINTNSKIELFKKNSLVFEVNQLAINIWEFNSIYC